jgi:hypothetical protein
MTAEVQNLQFNKLNEPVPLSKRSTPHVGTRKSDTFITSDPIHGEKALLTPKEKELIPENGEMSILVIPRLMRRHSKPPLNLTSLQQ